MKSTSNLVEPGLFEVWSGIIVLFLVPGASQFFEAGALALYVNPSNNAMSLMVLSAGGLKGLPGSYSFYPEV